jgi:hypothetical protein
LPEDISRQAYNPLAVLHRLYNGEHDLPYRDTCIALSRQDAYTQIIGQPRVLNWFLTLAQIRLDRASAALDDVTPRALRDLLSHYLKGLSEGFRLFEEFDGLTWMPEARRERCVNLLLKPHPWERFGLGDLA